ncbi:BREX-1 system adenine-specific DNA-methyltransferase PglX [Mediterraneibacter glycyrrhizinilyticus]|uniref:BREX-1 system adenine-specific DNA-methyltransferase PglX n=1 Tax=Mediterraneibacter glycyrrhizinilyticus TaxID=342942 RepID=UPI001D084AF2|nr:BREX-1 system adenine-specific DNA-methyltransferase PglX [Mediterraneibacter glycyrrhizinilyticus]MCB6308421.1 BREX-1 system adenine-specific DNA-methyltransferase PglX [Lachnospiraceae bacterium 210521-DFI.1.109]MCB6426924.1 BREX-1 system adenine-specific DNA-methyltransferase PglX [Mediterraneibacter glycyrrhizinilyticus]
MTLPFEVERERIGFDIKSLEEPKKLHYKWFPYNKGGEFKRWYGNRYYIVNWENDGYDIKHCFNQAGKLRSRPQNTAYYFRPCITWSDITSAQFSGRYCEGGFIFDVKGSSGFPDEDNILYVLGFLNSKISQKCIKMLNPTITTQVGDMARIPICFSMQHKDEIDSLVKECISIVKEDWDNFEISWEFKKHPLIRKHSSIKYAFELWKNECENRFSALKQKEERLNEIFLDIYGLQAEIDAKVDDRYVTVHKADLKREIRSLISYFIGCMFGRYSLNKEGIVYAGGKWNIKQAVDLKVDSDNIIPICDEEYFKDDIVNLLIDLIKDAYGEEYLEENLKFITNVLNGDGEPKSILREYFLNEFYRDHCNAYQITGSGKRPIYWLFDSGKQNGFKALIYMHRYDADTVGRVRTDYLHRAQKYVETAMQSAQYTIDNASSASEKSKATKAITKYTKQLAEMKIYDEAIAHIANKRIEIDLDDGVKVNYEKFQGVEVAQEGKKTLKVDLLAKIK